MKANIFKKKIENLIDILAMGIPDGYEEKNAWIRARTLSQDGHPIDYKVSEGGIEIRKASLPVGGHISRVAAIGRMRAVSKAAPRLRKRVAKKATVKKAAPKRRKKAAKKATSKKAAPRRRKKVAKKTHIRK